MAVSQARSDSARRNGARGKGPVTPRGKEVARANSLAHGLTGQGVVLREEDQPAVDDTEEELLAELRPRTALGRFLVRRLAVYMNRLDRGERHEEACLAHLVRHAEEEFDDRRLAAPEA